MRIKFRAYAPQMQINQLSKLNHGIVYNLFGLFRIDIDKRFMVSIGLLACSQSFASIFCIVQKMMRFRRVIECIVSLLMLIAVGVILVRRLRKQRRISFYIIVSVSMMLTLVFIIAYAFDTDIDIFNFLYLYFYNAYFSIIVFKLATKVLQKFKQSPYYKCYRLTLTGIFAIYAILVIAALVYRVIQHDNKCQCKNRLTSELPFLIASSFNLTAAIIFLMLGINHIKWQQQKIDQHTPENQQNNPLPRFRIWIVMNCIGQLMVLIQTIVYEVNDCNFSSNATTNQIVSLIFVFACFHTGMISTVYFFLHSAPDIKSKGMIRKTSNASANNKMEIELVYHDFDEIRTKMVSI